MPDLAPIAIFAFNRPRHLERLISSLEACEELAGSQVWLFCDGPRMKGDERVVGEVAGIADRLASRYRCHIVRQRQNRGLAASIVEGITLIANQHGRVVVLEDDLVVSRGFLRYMNHALDEYAACDQVLQVSGHSFPAELYRTSTSASFIPMVTTWGWGTWARAWARYDATPLDIEVLDSDPALRRRFDLGGAYPYYRMLSRESKGGGLASSWGIRWYWTLFRADGVSLFPHRTLVRHVGDDGSGTNYRVPTPKAADDFTESNQVGVFPSRITPDPTYFAAVREHLAADQSPFRKAIRYARSAPQLLRRSVGR